MQHDTERNEPTPATPSDDKKPSTEIAKWLQSIGMAQYTEAFEAAEVDMEVLPHLSYLDLKELGVKWQRERMDILKKAAECCTSPRKPLPSKWKQRKRTVNGELKSTKATSTARPPTQNRQKLEQPTLAEVLKTSEEPPTTQIRQISTSTRGRSTNGSSIEAWEGIPGTDFVVDRFRRLAGLTNRHWFLTHFHSDHYNGLTKSFSRGQVYCSSITAKLVETRIGLNPDRLHIVPLNETVTVNGARVTFLDANHCPGAVMIVVEGLSGPPVLHTGDARLTRETYENATLQRLRAQGCHLVLDTTYCDPKYSFPAQSSVIQCVCDTVMAELFNEKTLFLFGTYGIGKERLFLEVAKKAQRKVYVGRDKMALLKCMDWSEEELDLLTTDHTATNLHVVALWKVRIDEARRLLKSYAGRFTHIIGFRPTGWSFSKDAEKGVAGQRETVGKITIHQVPYSEHSSFNELREFVQWLEPGKIVPSVGNDEGAKRQQMLSWLRQTALAP